MAGYNILQTMQHKTLQEVARMTANKTRKQVEEAFRQAPGWATLGSGYYKTGFAKGNVVVKVPKTNMGINDWDSPTHAVGAWATLPKELRRFICKPLFIGQHFIAQEMAPGMEDGDRFCGADRCTEVRGLLAKAWKKAGVEEKYRLSDGNHNHGHHPNGEPVWFDGF